MIPVRKTPQGAVFEVLVQPRSSKNMVAGIHAEALKIKLTAPPVDNAANRMCLQFLAKSLGVPKSCLEIIAGHHSRRKQVLVRIDSSHPRIADYQTLQLLLENLAVARQ